MDTFGTSIPEALVDYAISTRAPPVQVRGRGDLRPAARHRARARRVAACARRA
jgi:hypothetical protein